MTRRTLVEIGMVRGAEAPLLETALVHEAGRAFTHAGGDELAELFVGWVGRRDLVEADATCADFVRLRGVRGWARTSGGLGGGLGYGCEGCEWGLVGRAAGGLEAGGG